MEEGKRKWRVRRAETNTTDALRELAGRGDSVEAFPRTCSRTTSARECSPQSRTIKRQASRLDTLQRRIRDSLLQIRPSASRQNHLHARVQRGLVRLIPRTTKRTMKLCGGLSRLLPSAKSSTAKCPLFGDDFLEWAAGRSCEIGLGSGRVLPGSSLLSSSPALVFLLSLLPRVCIRAIE